MTLQDRYTMEGAAMTPSDQMLKGRTAIVTGAASGIGRAIAGALAGAGAAVCVADLSEEGVRRAAVEIEGEGGRAIAVTVDVGRWEQVEAMVGSTVRALGGADILVNNAGLQHIAPCTSFPWRSGIC
jgi:NAD(P)-dependent dehydrogenase (short-subunit alcohol dehydrogenase family)